MKAVTMTNDVPSDHDPWLKHMELWTMRVLKSGCLACVLIFVIKIVCAELGFKPWEKHSQPETPKTVRDHQ